MTKIMIVDDDVDTTNILGSIMKSAGYEPISVNDSTIAVQIASTAHPDLFLLDLMMPVIDGFKLCRMLRAEPEFVRTPIIIITALADSDSKIVAYGAGATDYVTKPYLPKELLAKINAIITNKRPLYDENGNIVG
jgi:two-component system sensor histidine kinase/response regulator